MDGQAIHTGQAAPQKKGQPAGQGKPVLGVDFKVDDLYLSPLECLRQAPCGGDAFFMIFIHRINRNLSVLFI